MELLTLLETLLLSLLSVIAAGVLGLVALILVVGDKHRLDRTQPPRSRWQLLKILFCEALPRLFAVLVLRQPLTEEEERCARRLGADAADVSASEGAGTASPPPGTPPRPARRGESGGNLQHARLTEGARERTARHGGAPRGPAAAPCPFRDSVP